MVPTKEFPGGLGRHGSDIWDLTKGMTKKFPVTTLKCEPMVLSMHRKGIINGARMGYGMVPEETHKGISIPSMWNSVPLARNKMIKNLLQFAPFIIIVCKTWPRGVTQSSCYKMRSLSAVPVDDVIQQDGSHVEIWNSLGEESLCRLYQMLLV